MTTDTTADTDQTPEQKAANAAIDNVIAKARELGRILRSIGPEDTAQ